MLSRPSSDRASKRRRAPPRKHVALARATCFRGGWRENVVGVQRWAVVRLILDVGLGPAGVFGDQKGVRSAVDEGADGHGSGGHLAAGGRELAFDAERPDVAAAAGRVVGAWADRTGALR